MPYVPKPNPCFLDKFAKYRIINGRQVYKGDKYYYSYDEKHGEIEVFDFKGWHWGVIDAITGKLIKDAVKGRRLDVH